MKLSVTFSGKMNKTTSAVLPYDPAWAIQFNSIQNRIFPLIQDFVTAVEHVGSTSVPGLAAKPVIDIDAIYMSSSDLPKIIERLEGAGYQHEGDKGIEGREAFKAPEGIRHHLYVCLAGCLALRNHLTFRDHLRSHPIDRDDYGKLKIQLMPLYESSPEKYVAAKTEFILKILQRYELSPQELGAIAAANMTLRFGFDT